MTAKVYEFKSRERLKSQSKKQPPTVFAKTNSEIYGDVLDDVLGEWQAAASRDQLNEYLTNNIPVLARKGWPEPDFVNDLNLLSSIEKKLKMKVAIFYPGCTPANKIGWLAAFHVNNIAFATPPDMASEGYARSICIILFIEFNRHMKTLGR